MFKIAMSQTTLHLLADRTNGLEVDVTFWPALLFFYTATQEKCRFSPAGWLERHVGLAIMAVLFSISV